MPTRDVEAGGLISAGLEFDLGAAAIEIELNQGISSDGHEGTRVIVGAAFSRQVGDRLQLGLKPFVVWSDRSYADAF